MGYHVKIEELLEVQNQMISQLSEWGTQLETVYQALETIVVTPCIQGETGKSIQNYIQEVHIPVIGSLQQLLTEFQVRLSVYAEGYYGIDSSYEAEIPQEILEEQQQVLENGREDFENLREEINSVISSVSDIVSVVQPSGLALVLSYQLMESRVKTLNSDIGDYEETHQNDTQNMDSIDNLKDIQDMVYKKIIRQKKHSYFLKPVAAVGTICLVTGSIVLAKTLLAPGGKVEKAENLEKEHTLYESDTEEGKIVVDIQTELLDKAYLYQNDIPIAKHILEIQTDFYGNNQQIYVENGTMLILQDHGKGIFLEEDEKAKISVSQENMEKQPSHTFEIGYIENGKPFKLDTVAVEQYEVWVEGGDQKEYFPYFKNISSDRIILNYQIAKESGENEENKKSGSDVGSFGYDNK